MSVINQFNGLGGTIATRESLETIKNRAVQEGNDEIISRIDTLLAAYPTAKKFNIELDEHVIETVPESFLYGLDYEEVPDEPQGLGKVSPTEVYDMITAKIIKMIEEVSSRDYKKKWNAKEYGTGYTVPFNFVTKKRYRGVNVLMLTELEPLENPFFLTFKQVKDLKGKVKKGAKGFEVVYFTKIWRAEDKTKALKFSSYDKTKVEAFATENEISNDLDVIPMLKYYHVYNGKDIEGIDFDLPNFKIGYIDIEKPSTEANKMPIAEAILENYPKPQPTLKFGGDRAFYSPGKDAIQMPYLADFETVQDYYRTLFHEYSHSTGSTKRLARDFSGSQGSKKYAFEELVAELGAIFLSAEAGIIWHNNKNHAAYLKGWNSVLTQIKEDNKFIMRASTAAQKVADFVLQFDEKGDPLYFETLNKIVEKAKEPRPKKTASNYGKKTKRVPKPKAPQYPFSENDIPYETAYRAYTGISFSPEKRAVSEQKGYFSFLKLVYDENLIIATKNDKIDLFKANFESFQKGYLKRSLHHLRSKHGIFSSMIAGPAKFPVARMEKLNRIANDKLNELIDYSNKGQKRLLQNITPEVEKPIKTGATGTLKILQEKLAEAELIHKRNLEGNRLLKKIRSNPKATVQDLTDGLINIGFDPEKAKKEAIYMTNNSFAGFFTTNSNAKVKRIKEQIALEEKLNAVKENTGNIEYAFDGGTVLLNYEVNKIQIFYTEKPSEEERAKLKKAGNAFKWSPFNKAWQRQLNTYHVSRLKELFPSIDLKSVEKPVTKTVANVQKMDKARLEKANPVSYAVKPKSASIQAAVKDILTLSKFKKEKELTASIIYKHFSEAKDDEAERQGEFSKFELGVLEKSPTLLYDYDFDYITPFGVDFVQSVNNRLESLRNQKHNLALFDGLKAPKPVVKTPKTKSVIKTVKKGEELQYLDNDVKVASINKFGVVTWHKKGLTAATRNRIRKDAVVVGLAAPLFEETPKEAPLAGLSVPITNNIETIFTAEPEEIVLAEEAVPVMEENERIPAKNKLMQMQFESLPMDEGWENFMQNPAKNMKIAIWGPPKNGKTAGALQLANYLTKFGTVLYNFADQGFNLSTQELWKSSGLADNPKAEPTDADTLDALEKELNTIKPTFCFIDMISDYIRKENIKPQEFKARFIKKYPNVSFILVFEVTKGGNFKGDQGWTHLVDAIVTVEDFLMENRGRYGMGYHVVWEEGFKRYAPKRYEEIKEFLEPEEELVFTEEVTRI